MYTWYLEARMPMTVSPQSSMVAPKPSIIRRGSPDPNSRYPRVTPFTSPY